MVTVKQDANQLYTRSARLSSADAESRSAHATLATEQPVMMYDSKRWELVPEVLLMDGAQIPTKLPLLNSHSRSDVGDVLGSVTGISNNNGELTGTVTFASTADNALQLVREGHLTDLSVGYRIIERQHVPKGETRTIKGRQFTGPQNVVTAWRPYEVSVTPIGADSNAKFRSDGFEGEEAMEGIRELLIEAGLKQDATTDEGRAFLKDLRKRADSYLLLQSALKAGIPEDEAGAIVSRAKTFKDGQDMITDYKATQAERNRISPHFTPGESQADKFATALEGGLTYRALKSIGANDEALRQEIPDYDRRSGGWQSFKSASIVQMAREWCREHGNRDAGGLSNEEAVRSALFANPFDEWRSSGSGYHTPADFPGLMSNVLNKSLLRGYTVAPTTWQIVFRTGPSVSDFKPISRIRLSEAANLDQWPGIDIPKELALTDEKEVYGVESYSNNISISYRTLVNDDLSGLSRAPMSLGLAAARTINYVTWGVVTANPTLVDGQPLFSTATGNRKKANYVASGGAPSVSTLGAAKALMRQQIGVNDRQGNASQAILNIMPKYFVVPATLEVPALQVIRSTSDPAYTNPGVFNPVSDLVPVIEPLLDANSTTAWYLFGDQSLYDTIEITFLAGQESPITRTFTDPRTLAYNYTVLQSFGVKAIDHRPCFKNNGA